eukprot:4048394-Pyramimonas_sp.AAC.1
MHAPSLSSLPQRGPKGGPINAESTPWCIGGSGAGDCEVASKTLEPDACSSRAKGKSAMMAGSG